MPYNGVYAKVSAAAMAHPTDTKLQSEVQTVFRGTTLRGLLLEAYAFWKIGQIALIGAIVSFFMAASQLSKVLRRTIRAPLAVRRLLCRRYRLHP